MRVLGFMLLILLSGCRLQDTTSELRIGDEFKHIDNYLDKLEFGKNWQQIKKIVGIKSCSMQTSRNTSYYMNEIDGASSGVVVDGGVRSIYELTILDKRAPQNPRFRNGPRDEITLRFSYDRVLRKRNKPFCGFELFIKTTSSDQPPAAFALDFDGGVLDEVPTFLAFNKSANKILDSDNQVVRGGLGCYSCHPSVSVDYEVQGLAGFWNARSRQPDRKKILDFAGSAGGIFEDGLFPRLGRNLSANAKRNLAQNFDVQIDTVKADKVRVSREGNTVADVVLETDFGLVEKIEVNISNDLSDALPFGLSQGQSISESISTLERNGFKGVDRIFNARDTLKEVVLVSRSRNLQCRLRSTNRGLKATFSSNL